MDGVGMAQLSLYENVYENESAAYKAFRDAFPDDYEVIVTGDACVGDEIVFGESVFTGNWRRAKYAGCRVVRAKIIRDSYGDKCGQHTFTLELPDGTTRVKKARNVYANWTMARGRDASERRAALEDKHERGREARLRRDLNRARRLEDEDRIL